jgi:hypothetical protein
LQPEEVGVSVFQVASWSVRDPDVSACAMAVEAIGSHVRDVHPTVKSFRTFRQIVGPFPHRTYVVALEYESLTALDQDPDTPSCTEVWAPIFAMAEPRSFSVSMWSAPQRETWFDR